MFCGLGCLKRSLKKRGKRAISLCKSAGIKTIIVTGDHKLTAIAIAKDLGMEIKIDEVLEGKELEKIEDKNLKELVKKIKILIEWSQNTKSELSKHCKKMKKLWQ